MTGVNTKFTKSKAQTTSAKRWVKNSKGFGDVVTQLHYISSDAPPIVGPTWAHIYNEGQNTGYYLLLF